MKVDGSKYLRIITCILFITTVLFCIYRCVLGADIGDEALYISDPMFVAHGATPYVNNWLQTPGFSFFLAPVIALYELCIPTHEGIFLFMRFFFLVIKIIVYIGISMLFKNTRYKNAIAIIGIPLIANFYGVIPTFNYTNIPLLGLMVVGVLLLYQWKLKKQNECEKKLISYVAGVILACITLCSPTQILNCLVIMIFYYTCVGKKAGRQYIVGGILTALFFSVYMIIRAGSLSAFIHSLDIFLKHPYFSFGASTLSWQAYQIFPMISECLVVYLICWGSVEMLRKIFLKKYTFLWSCQMGLAVGAFIGIVFLFFRYTQYSLWNRIIILLSMGCFFLRFISENKELNKLFDFIAIPEIVTFMGMAFTVYGGVENRFYVFVPMALTCFMYIYDILKGKIKEKSLYLIFLYIILFLAVLVKYQSKTIYGEFIGEGETASASILKTRIEQGVYAGIYTTTEKAETLQKLEKYIRANTKQNEHVLFMDRVPMAYLMTDARFCAPTSWDPQLYSEGYREESTMLEDYFDEVNQVPDKIIYVQISDNIPNSIVADDYEFTQYVKENYSLKSEEEIVMYRVKVYIKN